MIILEKSVKHWSCYCTCTAGIGETRNHIAAAMFRVEAAVPSGLSSTSCTSSSNEWLPCKKDIKPKKIKDINFGREDFAQRAIKKKTLVDCQKKKFNPLTKSDKKP